MSRYATGYTRSRVDVPLIITKGKMRLKNSDEKNKKSSKLKWRQNHVITEIGLM